MAGFETTAHALGIADQLQPWALRAFEAAFDQRGRGRCSVEDFWLGYRSALVDLKVWSYFRTPPLEAGDGR